jgi:uncharacterized sulfatase
MSDQERPNVVLAVTDTMGWELLGCGGGFCETPTVDRLAREGVRCDSAYAAAPTCTPSRAGLFTGRYPHSAGGWANNVPLYETTRTMGEYFADAGYDVGYVGKWHLDGTDYFGTGVAPDPYPQEFWYDGHNYLADLDPEERAWWVGGKDEPVATYDPAEMHERGVTREDTWAGRVTDRARAFVDEAEEPYLLVVSYDEPHCPSVCPPPFCDARRGEPFPLPENYETVEELRANGKPAGHVEQAREYRDGDVHVDSISGAGAAGGIRRDLFFGCVEFVDDEIGRVLDRTGRSSRDTVTLFTTDHGHHLGAHGLDGKGGTVYDEVCRVPLIAHAPGRLPAGERRDAVASQVDVLPTLLELAGVERPPVLHGQSMRSLLVDGESHREHALVEYHRFGDSGAGFEPIRCLVGEEYKLAVTLFDTDELYERGGGEVENRIDDPAFADARDALHDALLAEMARTRDPFHGAVWKDRPWREDTSLTAAQAAGRDLPPDGFRPPGGEELIPDR